METVAPRIRIPARSHCLEQIRNFCGEILRGTIERELYRKMILAIDEAVANVIEHAYDTCPCGDPSTIEVELQVHPGRVVVRIVDHGIPFDPTKGPPAGRAGEDGLAASSVADGATKVAAFHRKGYGLQLIRLIMDKIEYYRTSGGENVLVLTKNIP
jgi:anti-sigma regulatory factor (Ser/Thr protein kinase)